MTRVRLYAHPLDGQAEMLDVPNLAAWLVERFGAAPAGRLQVFTGEPSGETEITDDVQAILAGDQPEYVVLLTPGDPGTMFIFQVVLTVVSVAMALMAQPPRMPANVNRSQQSPNNALGNRENEVRIGQRVEDIFGTVKAIPSLMMPTYNKFIDHVKVEYGYYCISRGYIDAAAIKDGESLLSEITGASAAVYWPFTSPNSGLPVLQIGAPIIDTLLTVTRSNEVDGITLKALNQLQLTPGETYTFKPDAGGDQIVQDRKRPNVNAIVEPGDEITVTMSTATVARTGPTLVLAGVIYTTGVGDPGYENAIGEARAGDTITVSSSDATRDGIYTVTAVGADNITVSPPAADGPAAQTTVSLTRNYSGTYEVEGVADGFLVFAPGTFPNEVETAATITVVTDTPVTEWTDWTTLDDATRTELWVNIVAPNGMYKDDGGFSNAEVEFELEIERLDPGTLVPTGTVEVVTATLAGSVTDERATTVEHATAWTGPARVRMRRTTQYDYDFEGRVSDEIKWADLYGVTPVAQADFGNKTTIHTVTQATTRSTAVKTRQLNCIASRLLPTFNGSTFSGAFDATGRHVSGDIHPTSRLVDILAAVAVDPRIGARDTADIDVAQIHTVQQQLDAWSPHVGQFNYTFDSDNMSFEETAQAIANAGFCTAYRQNGRLRLALDRPQASSTALFTHRNKKPNAETITRAFASDGEYDGVEFVYADPDSEQSETIKLPLDGSARTPKKFELPGIRSFAQAWYRANREYRKLRGQRVSIETETTTDARMLLPHARIDVVDNTRFRCFDGEVIGQEGLTLTLSQRVELEPGEPHSIVLIRRDGSVQSIACNAGPTARKVVLAHAPDEALVTQPGPDGIRTIFSVASDSRRQAMACLVNEIEPTDDGYITVRAVNYSDSYYEADAAPVPDKGGIIN